MTMDIFIDIETIPDQRPGALDSFIAEARENFKAPSGLTKEQAAKDLGLTDANEIRFTSKDVMLERWADCFCAERAGEVGEAGWRKTSFDGARGQVAVIGVALNDSSPVSIWSEDWRSNDAEANLLSEAFRYIAAAFDPSRNTRPRFIGHNVVAFDLRFLFQRAVILGVQPPMFLPRNPRPWDDCVFDTMVEWAGVGNRVSLDTLCRSLGIPGKGSELDGEEIDGAKVWDFVRDGRIADVATYCAADVERTRAIYRRMTFAKAA